MKSQLVKVFAIIAFVAMVVVNFLANSLPINNRSTGDISNDYENLFAPAGLTFSIWGLIYLLLFSYLIYQFIKKDKKELFNKINGLFLATSIANISWILAWHYDYIGLSVVIMAILLFLLIKIADINRVQKFSTTEKVLIRAPFSVYFGWITVATIANITVFLVSINWNRFDLSELVWTIIILFVGAMIGIWRMFKDRDIVYALVLIWAYLGIFLKHVSVDGFDYNYPEVVYVVFVCLSLFLVSIAIMFNKKRIS